MVSLPRLLALIAYLLLQPTTELLGRVGSLPDVDDACLSLLRASLAWLSLIHDQSPASAAAAERELDPRPIPPWE